MTEEQERINDALERVSLTVLDKAGRAAALAPFGEAVAAGAEAVHHDAVSQPPAWGDETDAGRGRVEALLRARYPWLSDRARGSLVSAYLYNWK